VKLSAKSRYGLSAAIELANCYGEGANVAVVALAEKIGVSDKFLEQIMSVLKKENIVTSTRGASGGYVLTNPPADTTVGQILRALEDNLEVVECVGDGECVCPDKCASFVVWNKLYAAMNDALNSINLASLI
jgi:Rrf2 family protein